VSATTSPPAWLNLALAALIPVVLIFLAALIYFRILVPRRKMKPYQQALELLSARHYSDALPLLTSIEGKLPDQLRREARFLIAFAYYQTGNTTEAEHMLGTLYREDSSDPNVAYLLAHIRVEKKLYDEAELVLEQMEVNKQLGVHHARKLLGLVKFQRGLTALHDGRIEAASELFEKVKSLGDYAARIPADIRNRHILLGTRGLFDKDVAAARKQFESLQTAAAQLASGERTTLLATAKLGLALADWIEEKPGSYTAVEKLLAEAARLFSPNEPLERPWPDNVGEKDIEKKLADIDVKAGQSAEQRDFERCLRDLHFLRGMAVLKAWSLMDGKIAYDNLKVYYQTALLRFACALAHDEDFSDVLLIVGLLKFYLHQPGKKQRTEGIDLLERAQKGGMREPDAMEIINNRRRIEAQHADAVDKYLQTLDKYLNDDTVRTEVRKALIERLSRYKRVQEWGRRPDPAWRRSVEPTVGELHNRSETLCVRIEQILASQKTSDDLNQMRKLSGDLREGGAKLYEQARSIERTEAELLVMTGNQLLRDQ
jgi:hypothetical protein